jgi:hypothetical protein
MLKTDQVLHASAHLSVSYYGHKLVQIPYLAVLTNVAYNKFHDGHFYELENLGISVRFSDAGTVSSLPRSIHTGSGAHQETYSLGRGGSLLGRKWPEREAQHSAV